MITEPPFKITLSLEPLLELWRLTAAQSGPELAQMWASLEKRLAEAPELGGPIEDAALLEAHQPLLKTLMGLVFPVANWDTALTAASAVLQFKPFFYTPSFQRCLMGNERQIVCQLAEIQSVYAKFRHLRAYFLILRHYYGFDLAFTYPLVWTVPDPVTGLDRHYRFDPDLRFVRVRPLVPPPALGERERAEIMNNLTDLEVLASHVPAENFEFSGFTVLHATDVTTPEVISALERDLIDQNSIFSTEGFGRIQRRLQTLFGRPSLTMDLAAVQGDKVLLFTDGCAAAKGCLFLSSRHFSTSDFEGSLFERAFTTGQNQRVADLRELPQGTRVEEIVQELGGRSALAAPLRYQNEVIGTLDLVSKTPGDLGPLDELLLEQVLPLFSVALKRGLDDFHNVIQSLIKEKCTAIHPTVEWRFRQAAMRYLDLTRNGQTGEMEPIVFKDIYPLYAVADIRGSSEGRNQASQTDLAEQLRLAQGVLHQAAAIQPWPMLQELAHRIQNRSDKVLTAFEAVDETTTATFLHQEIEPVFDQLAGLGAGVAQAVLDYRRAQDPVLGSVYHHRQEFERSVGWLNERLSTYLDREEAYAQTIFPHYFEKHQTDGVDYMIYLGQSLVEQSQFNDFHLRNLRLWQLMVACGLVWVTERLKSELPLALETANLVLFHSTPMSIRFRYDEKRFDVEGAYDVRHEIIKSRIDKAQIKGRGERLTQPGLVAVVYSLPEEDKELRRHVDFLQAQGFFKAGYEPVDLEDLPGVRGLKALRVEVNLDSPALAERVEGLLAGSSQR